MAISLERSSIGKRLPPIKIKTLKAGRPKMTSTHGNWFRSLVAALSLSAAFTGTTTVWAQGFGPDPFRPYNSEYDPYVYPIGPATPGAGQSAPMNVPGNRNANQYQNFLNELSGPSYLSGDRYGIGQPYYRSTVDQSYNRHFRPAYQPKLKAEKSFEDVQREINEKYFAYLDEKDPRKRARLLRDFNQARALATRALSTRRETPARILESATRLESELEPEPTTTGRTTGRASAPGPAARSTQSSAPKIRSGLFDMPREGESRSLPPPPPLPFGSTSTRAGTLRTPTDVLNRARKLDNPFDSQSKPAAKGARDKGARDRRSNPIPPPPSLSPGND
jgi:hypothetical protein